MILDKHQYSWCLQIVTAIVTQAGALYNGDNFPWIDPECGAAWPSWSQYVQLTLYAYVV